MKILVCITHVPDTTAKISFTDNDTKFDANGVQFIIGPYDDYALARAVELKEASGGSVTVLNVGTAETEPTIRKALAIGADDAIRINAEPTDSMFVAQQIANHAKDGGYDLIMMGRESIDFNGGMVHGMVGELLGMPATLEKYEMPPAKGEVKMIDADNVEELVQLLKNEAKVL
jgi:electron transfer flavoprotein beta subunit